MVTPLYLASLFIDKRNFLEKPIFRKAYREVTYLGRRHTITYSNLISFLMFAGMGLIIIFLALAGKLSMQQSEESVTQLIQSVALSVTGLVQQVPGLDIAFVLLALWLLYRFIRYVGR
jgi:uncharacterized protein YybS (DUF2232 family)